MAYRCTRTFHSVNMLIFRGVDILNIPIDMFRKYTYPRYVRCSFCTIHHSKPDKNGIAFDHIQNG